MKDIARSHCSFQVKQVLKPAIDAETYGKLVL